MLLALLASALWTFSDALVKVAGLSGMPLSHIIVPYNVSGALIIAAIAAWRGQLRDLFPKRLKAETLRALVLTALCIAIAIGYIHLPLTTVYAVVFFAPLPIAILAAKFMHEQLSWQHYAAMIVGFFGVLLALNPASLNVNDGELLGYIVLPFCLILYVINILMMRLAGRSSDTAESMAFYPQFVRVVLLLPFFIWQFQPLAAWQWACVLGLGGLSGLAWLLFSAALKYAPAAVVSPVQYSEIVIGGIIGYLIWSHIPSWHLVLGSVIIIAAGYYMARLTNREKLSSVAIEVE